MDVVFHYNNNNTGDTTSLQSVGLGGNDIHDEGATHLAHALKTNTKLRSLGLGGNQIGKARERGRGRGRGRGKA